MMQFPSFKTKWAVQIPPILAVQIPLVKNRLIAQIPHIRHRLTAQKLKGGLSRQSTLMVQNG